MVHHHHGRRRQPRLSNRMPIIGDTLLAESLRDALGSHWGRNQLALYRPWGGFMVALGGGLGGFDRLQLNSEDTKAENRVILAISAKVAFSWLFLRVFAPSLFTLYCGDKALVLSDLRR